MTRSRYHFFETDYPYFLTCTIVGWLPVFTRPEAVEIIYDSLRYSQRQRGLNLLGYVILENHLHLIASAPDLSDVIQRFKSFTARQSVELLESRGEQSLLRQLQMHKLRYKPESQHQVWEEGSHPQQIQTDEMMWQKLEYIHNNPVRRGYVDDPVHWRYSSARDHAGQEGLIPIHIDW